jgi:hypothetical protein
MQSISEKRRRSADPKTTGRDLINGRIGVPAVQQMVFPEASTAVPCRGAAPGSASTYHVTIGMPLHVEYARISGSGYLIRLTQHAVFG